MIPVFRSVFGFFLLLLIPLAGEPRGGGKVWLKYRLWRCGGKISNLMDEEAGTSISFSVIKGSTYGRMLD